MLPGPSSTSLNSLSRSVCSMNVAMDQSALESVLIDSQYISGLVTDIHSICRYEVLEL